MRERSINSPWLLKAVLRLSRVPTGALTMADGARCPSVSSHLKMRTSHANRRLSHRASAAFLKRSWA